MIRNLGQVAAIYIGSSQPTNTNLIWLDNTVVPYAFRAYDGSTWSELATRDWVKMFVDGWLVSLPPSTQAGDTDYLLINSNNVNYKITVKEFVKSAVGNPLDFKGVIRTDADFPNPANCEAGDMYVIITSPAGGTVTDPYSGQVFEDTEKIVWDEVTKSWASLGKIEINVDLSTDYSATNVTINSSAGKGTTINAASTSLAGVMLPQQVKFLAYLSNGSTVPGEPSELDPDTPAHKHNYGDILNRLISQQEMGDSTYHPMSQKVTTDNLNLKFDKANVVQVQGAATDMVMSQKAVTDALKTLSDDFNNKLTNYLPLAGGTMKGNIVFNNNLFLNWKDTKGSTYQVLSMKSNDEINIGNAAFPLNLYSKEDLFHKRNGENVYRIYDAYNLPDPATLSGNNVFTGNNTFQAGKFNVSSFEVTSNGSLLSNISSPAGSAWSRNLTFRANSDSTSSFIFGGYNSVDNTSIGYAYIGIGDVTYSTAQYKFYANSLKVPYKWSIDGPDGNSILWSQTSEIVNLGRIVGTTKIRSGNTDLIHTKGSTEYIIWDKSNLPNPVRYALDASNYPTLLDSNGSSFSYIKAGPGGILPNTSVSLNSGGTGYCGTLGWSFKDGYFANVHTYKILIGPNETFIDSQSGDSNHRGIGFYTSQNAACPVYVGSLCVSDSYANGAPNIPTNGIYSKGNIRTNGWISFTNNVWTDEGGAYKEEDGSLKVLSVPTDSSQPKPSTYGSVLQFNSRKNHWCTQIWSDQVNSTDNPSNGKLRYRTTKSYATTEWNPWTAIATEDYVGSNYLPLRGGTISSSKSNPLTINSTHVSQSSIDFSRGGVNKGTVGFHESLGSFLQNVTGETLAVKSDGAYYGANINSLRKLATVTDLNNYLPLTGGTLSGNLTINTVGGTTFVINNNDTNGSGTFMRVLRKGTASAAIGFLDSLGAYIYNYNSNKYLFIDNDGYARVGTTNGSTRLALITDIPSISGYLPLSGGTLTGALTMSSRRNNIVVDVVGGAGQSWNEGAGALSVQVPSDSGQTPLLLARRSGATINTTTLSERLLDIALLDTGTIFRVGMSGVNALELDVTSFTNKVGIGKLFGKQIATTDQIPSIPSISISNSGSGNAVTAISASGHTLTVTKGATYLTSHQTIYDLTFQAGTFVAKTFDPNGAAATVNIPTNTSHLTNDSGFITSSALNGYATQSWVNSQNFVKSTSTKKVTDIQPVDALPATQVSGVLYLVFG